MNLNARTEVVPTVWPMTGMPDDIDTVTVTLGAGDGVEATYNASTREVELTIAGPDAVTVPDGAAQLADDDASATLEDGRLRHAATIAVTDGPAVYVIPAGWVDVPAA